LYAHDHGYQTVLPFSGRRGFSYPALFGVLAIVFSLGKGLLFYTPGLFVPVRNGLARSTGLLRTRFLWLLLVAGLVAVYCRWWAWYGGNFFGPRFFLVASLPAGAAIAARLGSSRPSLGAVVVILVVLVLSFWVGYLAALDDRTPLVCTQNHYALEHLCWYTPEFSALWRPFIDWPTPINWVVAFGLLSLCAITRLAVPLVIAAVPTARARAVALARWLRSGERW
jgi:hypothetical protein